jgi:hypothetical protein
LVGEADVLAVVAISVDAIYYSNDRAPEVGLDGVRQRLLVRLCEEDFADEATSGLKLNWLILRSYALVNMAVQQLAAPTPEFAVWLHGEQPTESHPTQRSAVNTRPGQTNLEQLTDC